ncbi:hypothetical protein pipiens_019379 [Culex pipiens pipiens]|uniref:Uncharacterized protein n=1 Tax=Culex pipiens pipiens TaxID=38569 RepID=A0ABD1DUI4_CULPP
MAQEARFLRLFYSHNLKDIYYIPLRRDTKPELFGAKSGHHLLEKVLPRRKLGHFFYHVPMGGIELQKYHYAQNWWKDVRVFNC